MRRVLGVILGLVTWAWLRTLRVTLEVHPELDVETSRPWVLAFLHGKQWPLLRWQRRRRTGVMVSHSRDGTLQASALRMLGLVVVRGSSSRGGARGLAGLLRLLKNGHDAAFAVDGPRGPYGVPKAGAEAAAIRSSGLLIPMGSAMSHGKVFQRAWDRFELAWPFSRVAVVLGPPVTGNLGEAIERANGRAEALLAEPAGNMVEMPLR